MIASIRRTADGCAYRVTCPFDRAVVEAIKQLVPAGARTYAPDERAWYVSPAYRELVADILADAFLEVDTEAEASGPVPVPDEYRTLHLLPSAPPELVESAYKTLSRLHQPDHGGDTATMQAINAAVSQIRRQS